MNKEFHPERQDTQMDLLFQELQTIASILETREVELGRHVSDKDDFSRRWEMMKGGGGVIIDSDRNIRASINDKTGHWKIWFTNELENSDHPLRVQITSVLRENGFEVMF